MLYSKKEVSEGMKILEEIYKEYKCWKDIKGIPGYDSYSDLALNITYNEVNRIEKIRDHADKLWDKANEEYAKAVKDIDGKIYTEGKWHLPPDRMEHIVNCGRLLNLSFILNRKSNKIKEELLDKMLYLNPFIPDRILYRKNFVSELSNEAFLRMLEKVLKKIKDDL